MFFVGSNFFQGIYKRFTQGTFIPNYNEIHWAILEKKFFKSFTICYIVKISPTHGGHVFCRINFFSRSLQEGNPRNNHTKLQWNPLSHYGEEDFLKLHYMSYSENKPRPRRPCFLSDQNFFKESGIGLPKEHSCQIIMKSIEPLWRRRFFND